MKVIIKSTWKDRGDWINHKPIPLTDDTPYNIIQKWIWTIRGGAEDITVSGLRVPVQAVARSFESTRRLTFLLRHPFLIL